MSATPGGQAQAVPRGDGALAVRGSLSFTTAPDVLRASADWVRRANGPLTIDLAEVERIDSAGLALLVEWVNLARGRELRFANVPEQARELIRVYGLSRALGLDNHD